MTKHTGEAALWTRSLIKTMLGMLFLFIPYSLYMPVMPAYLLEKLHSSMQVAGAVNGVFLVAAVLFRAQTARLEARFGIRRVLLISGLLFVATNLLYLTTDTIIGILSIRFLSGAFFAVVNTSLMALGSRLTPRTRQGEGMAYLTTMLLAGGAIGPYIGLSLSHSYGYHAVFIFSTLTTLLGMLIISFIPIREESVPVPSRFSFRDMFEVKAIPVSLIVLIIAFAYGGVLTFVVVYAKKLQLPLATDYFFVVMAGISVAARLVTGRMFDRLGPNVALYLAFTLLAGGLLTLGAIPSNAGMLAAAALIGIGYGMAVPSLQTLAIQVSPAYRSSAITATFFTCLDGGIGLGAYLLGGGIHAFGYAAVYLALGGLTLSCILIYYIIYARKHG